MNSWTLTCFRVAMLLPSILLVREAHCWNMLSRTTRRTYHVGHSSWPKSSSVQSSMSHHQSLCMVPTDANMDLSDMSENLDVDDDDHDVSELIPGIPSEFYIVKWYQVHHHWVLDEFDPEEIGRLKLLPGNVSLPVALMILDRDEFPSFSKARKVCRKGNILIHRGPLPEDCTFDLRKCVIGRVGDRVFPGDVIAKQIRMGSGTYPVMSYKQPFELPVVYEDDYFAIVNKPAGVVVYAHKQGGFGTMTVRSCLPFVLTPPKIGTYSVLRRPQPVHRLDKPTSGLLLIAKTKPAMQNLCKQFADRQVRKTYTAIVNGIPFETHEGAITSLRAAQDMDVDVDPKSEDQWQIINVSLDEKEALTLWRSQRFTQSLKARDNTLTMVELKPKTGRYHQLRRHMAWVCQTPLVGDDDYDGGGDAMTLRDRGLFLCSNRVTLEHPHYNTEQGRTIWDNLSDDERLKNGLQVINDKVMVTASIDLPNKFESFLTHEQERAAKFA